jgi:peptidoglycan/LPS O-acetylase OafA/YrhL
MRNNAATPLDYGEYTSKLVIVPSAHSADKYYIPTLDGWRAIAILSVIACHAGTAAFINNPKIHSLFSLGAYGVQIFFAISGFLITKRLLEEEKITSKISLKNFYARRFFRILPPAWFYLLCIFSLQASGVLFVDSKSWTSSLLLYKNYVKDSTWYLSHFWSLAVEEQFYLSWPLLVFITPINSKKTFAVFAIILASLFSLTSQSSLPFYGLISSATLAILMTNKTFSFYLKKYLDVKVWSCLVFLMTLGFLNKIHISPQVFSWIFSFVVVGTVINPQTIFGLFLESKILKVIGKYSYSLYLWQQLFCLSDFPIHHLGIMQKFPINLLLTILMSLISYHLIEKPFIKLGQKVAPSPNPR